MLQDWMPERGGRASVRCSTLIRQPPALSWSPDSLSRRCQPSRSRSTRVPRSPCSRSASKAHADRACARPRWRHRAGTASPTTDHRPPTTDHRPPTTDHRTPNTEHRNRDRGAFGVRTSTVMPRGTSRSWGIAPASRSVASAVGSMRRSRSPSLVSSLRAVELSTRGFEAR